MDKQLRRILNLVRKTGDRMVVTDANGEDVYVVMGLEQYESLVDAPKQDEDKGWDEEWWDDHASVDKTKADSVPSATTPDWMDDLAIEPSAPIAPPLDPVSEPAPPPANLWEAMRPAGSKDETWDIGAMSPVEKADLERQFEAYQKTKRAEAPDARPAADQIQAAEGMPGASDEDFGEEQFYLEPVE